MRTFPRRRSRKFTCHYCGHAQLVTSPGPISQFTCESKYCEATNHIDAGGNIIDYVPPEPLEPLPRHTYARSFIRSPPPSNPQSPVLCRECQNNIVIKQQQLSNYLPSEDDPSYQIYLNQLPGFEKDLNDKYSAPCPDCAVKVGRKLKQVDYFAKTAIIGQLLERSENMKVSKGQQRWGFGRLCKLAWWVWQGTGWITMNFLMLAWHLLAINYPTPLSSVHHISYKTWNDCLGGNIFACYEATAYTALKLIPLSFLFIFWNYKAPVLAANPEAKLVGTKEYLKLDALVYGIRLLAWYLLAPGGVQFTSKAFKVVHFVFLVVSIVSMYFRATVLKTEEPRRVHLRDEKRDRSPSPCPSTLTQSPRRNQRLLASTPKHISLLQRPLSAPSPMESAFYVSNPTKSQQNGLQFQRVPCTPSPWPKDEDEMDWNPTTPGLSATDKIWMQPSVEQHAPSLFRLTSQSPVNAVPQAARTKLYPPLSSGLNRSQVQGDGMQTSFRTLYSGRKPTMTTDESSADEGESPMKPSYPPLENPRFLLSNEPTGLEGLMMQNFRLDDVPDVVKNALKSRKVRNTDVTGTGMKILVITCCMLSFFFIPRLLQDGESSTEQNPQRMLVSKLASLLAAASFTLWRLKKVRKRQKPNNAGWDINSFVSATESAAAFILMIYTLSQFRFSLPLPPSSDFSKLDLSGKLYFGFVLLRGFYDGFVIFLCSQREGVTQDTKKRDAIPQPTPPMAYDPFSPEKKAPIYQPVNIPLSRQNSWPKKSEVTNIRPTNPFGNFQSLPRPDQRKTNGMQNSNNYSFGNSSFTKRQKISQKDEDGIASPKAMRMRSVLDSGDKSGFGGLGLGGNIDTPSSHSALGHQPFTSRRPIRQKTVSSIL